MRFVGIGRPARSQRYEVTPVVLELCWAGDMRPLGVSDAPVGVAVSIVERWACPVCDRPVHRRPGPGRQRVYCTNACRQVAYRWRRDHLGPASVRPPVDRTSTYWRHHAVRRSDDPVGAQVRAGRRVAVCGAFARRAGDSPALHGHVALIHRDDEVAPVTEVCRRCVDLLGLTPDDPQAAELAAARARRSHEPARRRALARRRREQRRVVGGPTAHRGPRASRRPGTRSSVLA